MVGTDIVHALIFTGVTSLLDSRMHNVISTLLGAFERLDSRRTARFLTEYAGSVPWLRRIPLAVLMATGGRMLVA